MKTRIQIIQQEQDNIYDHLKTEKTGSSGMSCVYKEQSSCDSILEGICKLL